VVVGRPSRFFPAAFVFIWVAGTLGLHFISRPSSDGIHDMTFSWGGALGIAFFVAIVGTTLAYVFYYRRPDRDESSTRRLRSSGSIPAPSGSSGS
jgi:hypothetical protein